MGEQDVFHLQPANCIYDPLKVTPAQVFKADGREFATNLIHVFGNWTYLTVTRTRQLSVLFVGFCEAVSLVTVRSLVCETITIVS